MERSGISVRCSRLLEYSYPSLSIDTNHSYNYTKYSRDNPCHEITSYKRYFTDIWRLLPYQ
jgi:hypothetical protein